MHSAWRRKVTKPARVYITDLYTGMVEMPVSTEKMAKFRADEELELNGGKTYFPNEYCTLI